MECHVKDTRTYSTNQDDDSISGLLRRSINDPKLLPEPFKRGIPLRPEFVFKDYQYDVLKWALTRNAGVIHAQMGLGKTFMGICLSALDQKYPMPTLIVCPLNIVNTWVKEGFEKFFGNYYKVFVFHKSYNNIDKVKYLDLCKYDYVITTYDTVRGSESATSTFSKSVVHLLGGAMSYNGPTSENLNIEAEGIGCLHKGAWSHVIFDESHLASNKNTATFKSCFGLFSIKYWCLTGTPMRNKRMEFWAQLAMIHVFKWTYRLSYPSNMYEAVNFYSGPGVVYKVDYETARVKLPPLKREIVMIDYEQEQKKLYLSIIGEIREALYMFEKKLVTFSTVLAAFTQLRLCSISQKLVDPSLGIGNKLIAIIKRVKDIVNKGEKVVITSAFKTALDLLKDELEKQGLKCIQLDGKVPQKDRTRVIEKFQGSIPILLTTYKVGGLGLNLQFATNWIGLEPWWNESVHRQGYQRVWRVGQTKPCTALFFLGKGMESAVMKMADEKQQIIDTDGDFTVAKLDKIMIRRLISY